MTDPYRALCAELIDALDSGIPAGRIRMSPLANRARALLDQQEPEGPKPVVDYSRVTEIATEAQIRSAAQYLVKKRNCDGDLIPAIEYAIARWGRPTPQPVAASERLPGPEDCDEQGRCWWLKQRANPDHDLLMPTWHLQRQGPVGTTFFRFTHWLPANALPTPEANP